MSQDAIVLRADRWVDVDAGQERSPAVIEGTRIAAVNPGKPPEDARAIDLGDVTLLPGLMDMEINMLLGGPHGGNPRSDVQDDPAFRTLRAVVNCRTTLLAGFTTVRNLGLFVKTGGYLLDVALARAVDNGWIDGPRIVPAGHAITPTGGHLDPTMFQRFAPDVLPLRVEEGIANGVPEVRKAVRYQIKYGARLIKISASGGVMSHSGLAGAQQYSDEEIAAMGPWSEETVEKARQAVMKLDPLGCGARDVRECLLVQLEVAGETERLANRLISEHLSELQQHKLPHLSKQIGVDVDTLMSELQFIRTLDPYPGRRYSSEEPVLIAPEIYIEKLDADDEDYVIYFADDGSPRLD